MAGVYGLVSYDIAVLHDVDDHGTVILDKAGKPKKKDRPETSQIPSKLLKLGWLRVSKSNYMGDYARRDEVMALLRKGLTHERDVVFPALPLAETSESAVKDWVRKATERFFDEVVASMRLSAEGFMDRLMTDEKDSLGIGDVAGKVEAAVERASEKVEDFMIALATFRLSEEFKDFREAKAKMIDLIHDEVIGRLAKKAAEVEKDEATKAEIAKRSTQVA